MLTARDTKSNTRLALPDFRSRPELEAIRGRARNAELVCLACHQLLWLRAGNINIPHFAHRARNTCPHVGVPVSVLRARTLLYRYFQDRIAAGTLAATVQLEPELPNLPGRTHVDLLLRRGSFDSVAIVLLPSGLRGADRDALPLRLAEQGLIFRPVFLDSRLKPHPEENNTYLLDATQRDFRQPCAYGAKALYHPHPHTLHFIDPDTQQWLSLRSLQLHESPQAYRATQLLSPLSTLDWDDAHAEWIHPGEPSTPEKPLTSPSAPLPVTAHSVTRLAGNFSRPARAQTEPPATWHRQTLRCVGCHADIGEKDWVIAQSQTNLCVCRACASRGLRLPS